MKRERLTFQILMFILKCKVETKRAGINIWFGIEEGQQLHALFHYVKKLQFV